MEFFYRFSVKCFFMNQQADRYHKILIKQIPRVVIEAASAFTSSLNEPKQRFIKSSNKSSK